MTLLRATALCLSVLILGGCTTTRALMPTPTMYQNAAEDELFASTPPERQISDVELLYLTDRSVRTGPQAALPYGEERSRSLAYGMAIVGLGAGLDWAALERQSHLLERTREVNLQLGAVEELGRYPTEPYAMKATPAGVTRSDEVMQQHEAATTAFRTELRRQLERSPSKKVVLYVHGFNETFATAAYTTAELCHFLGRENVCAFFTWPASSSGFFLTSYTTTTEAAVYAVNHLRKAIRMIARTPGVESIELIGHSRGSAVLLDAFRELVGEAVVYGITPAEHIKIDNVILIAPDIDVDVGRQKITYLESDPDLLTHWAEDEIPPIINGRFTIYSSPDDEALSVSRFLFRSRSRVGQVSAEQIPLELQREAAKWGKLDVIIYRGERTDQYGHSYYVSNPQVSSDLIQLIRYGKSLGDPERPLQRLGPIVWTFPGKQTR